MKNIGKVKFTGIGSSKIDIIPMPFQMERIDIEEPE